MIAVSQDSLASLDIAKQYHYDLLSQKFKIVDCKLFYNLLLDLKRAKSMAKVTEDQFIFFKTPSKLDQGQMKRVNKKSARSSKVNESPIKGFDNKYPV